jgi:hypothetical protein
MGGARRTSHQPVSSRWFTQERFEHSLEGGDHCALSASTSITLRIASDSVGQAS